MIKKITLEEAVECAKQQAKLVTDMRDSSASLDEKLEETDKIAQDIKELEKRYINQDIYESYIEIQANKSFLLAEKSRKDSLEFRDKVGELLESINTYKDKGYVIRLKVVLLFGIIVGNALAILEEDALKSEYIRQMIDYKDLFSKFRKNDFLQGLVENLEKYETIYFNRQLTKCEELYPDYYALWQKVHSEEEKTKLKKFYLAIQIILSKMMVTKLDIQHNVYGHYTTLDNLNYFLNLPKDKKQLEESQSRKARKREKTYLRLNNVAFMSDPMEGIGLEAFLGEERFSIKEGREELVEKTIYLTSLTRYEDNFSMWRVYGDDARGVFVKFSQEMFEGLPEELPSITVNGDLVISPREPKAPSLFLEEGSENQSFLPNVNLYKVGYLDYQESNQKLTLKSILGIEQADSDKILESLSDIQGVLDDFKKDWKVLMPLLDEINYLFKDKFYQHEGEVRLLSNLPINSDAIQYANISDEELQFRRRGDRSEPFLKPFIDHTMPLKIEEIILGSKVKDDKYIVPFIKRCDPSVKVTRSSIKYR